MGIFIFKLLFIKLYRNHQKIPVQKKVLELLAVEETTVMAAVSNLSLVESGSESVQNSKSFYILY